LLGYALRLGEDAMVDIEDAEVLREYGPFPGAPQVNGVTFDGRLVWLAVGQRMLAVAPDTGEVARTIEVPAQAGSAFDGRFLYQIAGDSIQKIDHQSGEVVSTVKAPCESMSGMAWADGFLWIGEYNARKVHQVDPDTGAVVRSIVSDRFVTGVTWVQGELWHGTMQDDASDLRELDPQTGAVRRRIALPRGTLVSGLESNGSDVFYCGGATSGKLRAVRRYERRKR
jgi:glutamine cyclotransferase